ncbi:MAG: neutral/alkaline non-lysosomal ceramidase N-terminal domain-containing protein [Candidatus Brachytrichaceae bacterium NZ_4S206]|jgi:hypothetical protein
MPPLFAGADARTIHPSFDRPVYLAGFSRNRRATGTHDPLMVRTLAVSDGRATIVLAICDLIGLLRNDVRDIRARVALGRARQGKPPVHLVVACTHTHSGPDTIGLWGPDMQTTGYDQAYAEFVRQQVADSALSAATNLRPARLRAAMTRVPGIVRNFRDPRISDDELAALQAVAADDAAVFTLLNFPCHPEVMDDDNTLITADMAGFACRAVEREAGGVGVWASGHLGGMMSPDTLVRTFDECQRMGEQLAAGALRALRDAAFVASATIRIGNNMVTIPTANPLLQTAVRLGIIPRVKPEEVEGETSTETAAWGIGRLCQFAHVPGELLPKLGLQLKTAMTAEGRFIIGLANDELGYILPREDFIFPEDYLNPGRQYEESMSMGPEAGPRIMDSLSHLLRQTANQ